MIYNAADKNRKLDETSDSLIRHRSDLTHPIWTNLLLLSNESCLLCTMERKSSKYQKPHGILKVLGLSHAFDLQIKTCQNTCIPLTFRVRINRREICLVWLARFQNRSASFNVHYWKPKSLNFFNLPICISSCHFFVIRIDKTLPNPGHVQTFLHIQRSSCWERCWTCTPLCQFRRRW